MTDTKRVDDAERADAGASVKGRRRIPLLLAVAGLAYTLDLCSKVFVVEKLEFHAPVPVLGTWLELRVMRNSGAAFGLGGAMTLVFTLIAVAVAVAIVRLASRLYSVPWAIALGLLLGGALGNLTDRLFRAPGGLRGAVVDFLAVRGFSVMNFADWAIVCGGVLIVYCSFRGWELGNAGGQPGEVPAEAARS
ncbi:MULTISPECIES: signal peptidase II [unclassified Streptomyces]|uniref:signal peptidase II n=1 Tax=unclassified Streptomyces TaxID=2593676 RepID=UPI000C270DF6|nr:signal peptidase II [Streptomyces sp. CB02959]PJN35623.1 signal peptidase II [Streptomyces sp. CB02959]